MADFQIPRHLVERIHQNPDLVVRNDVDLVIEIALGYFAGRLRQILNGDRDALREINAEPGRGKDNEKRYNKQCNYITELDGILEQPVAAR